jgi:hypothetical protein
MLDFNQAGLICTPFFRVFKSRFELATIGSIFVLSSIGEEQIRQTGLYSKEKLSRIHTLQPGVVQDQNCVSSLGKSSSKTLRYMVIPPNLHFAEKKTAPTVVKSSLGFIGFGSNVTCVLHSL